MLLEYRIGEQFDAVVTSAADKEIWARLFHPPIEGRLASGLIGQDVGHRVRVGLVSISVERGDFRRVGRLGNSVVLSGTPCIHPDRSSSPVM
ncbi:MAG: hypothetical protein HGA43_14835 [Nitrospirae bacterium]|nr:hypothetical protein [Nitrospirota bacterium]